MEEGKKSHYTKPSHTYHSDDCHTCQEMKKEDAALRAASHIKEENYDYVHKIKDSINSKLE